MAQERKESFVRVDEDDVFEEIMKQVGRRGFFQRRFNIVFNVVFLVFFSMCVMNTILALTVPDHWCHVPGREATNLSLDEWKELTLPRIMPENTTYSSCEMYNVTQHDGDNWPLASGNHTNTVFDKVTCQHGWEYDKTWYSLTVPSQEDWVCENELKVTNVYSVGRFAEIIGSFCFSQLGDTIGRRPVFYIAIVLVVSGSVLSTALAGHYMWFLVATAVAGVGVSTGFQSPLVISMEVSDSETRAHIAMLQSFGWTAGICILPFVGWVSRDWVLIMLLTSLPCALFIFLYKQFPESPRWLAAKGKPVKCIKVLKYISKLNGTKVPDDAILSLQRIADKREKTYGIASLLSSWRLARNTMIICICWIVNVMVYDIILINVTTMSGNPFLNFFWQSIAELPGNIIGRVLSDRFGRRWVQSGAMLSMPVMCAILCVTVKDPNLDTLSMILVVIFKFCNTITFYVIYLQALEIYPTCIRQSGTSCGSLVASVIGISGPYLVYLGTAYDKRYPYMILGVMATVAGIVSAFLPETLHQKLPETLNDANHFGENQAFWTFNYSRVKQEIDRCDDQLKNEEQYKDEQSTKQL